MSAPTDDELVDLIARRREAQRILMGGANLTFDPGCDTRIAIWMAHAHQTIEPLATELLAARKRVAELEAERQWRPIETAPKDGSWFMGHVNGLPMSMQWMPGRAAFCSLVGEWEPTHWMPLPAPPKEKP